MARLHGTRARPRKPTGRLAPVKRLAMPDELEGAAAELWKSVVPKLCRQGVLVATDTPALLDMCLTWKALRECEAQLDREGRMIEGYRGSQVKHPLTSVVKGYRESFQTYLQKFGLQPMDRQRLPLPAEDPPPSIVELLQGWRVAREVEDEADPRHTLAGES